METVYATFRNKPTLLHRAWDVAVGGDEQDVHVLDRPEMRAVLAEPDLPTRFARFAAVNTAIMRRTARLRLAVQGAAGTDPAAAALLAEIDRARLEAMGVHARAAAATGQLAVPEEECRDVLFATTDGSLWHSLVERRRLVRRALRGLARPPLGGDAGRSHRHACRGVGQCTAGGASGNSSPSMRKVKVHS